MTALPFALSRRLLPAALLALAGCATAPVAPPPPVAPSVADTAADAPALAPLPDAGLEGAGMVSAADPRAAEAGVEMLDKGGSATDAAIATMLALGVVEPQSSGIGGGGYYLRGTLAGPTETIDGRETAPRAATGSRFLDADGKPLDFPDAQASGNSVGVPGNLALAAEAHRLHGRLPWATLFEPAIRLARDGWTLSPRGREFLDKRRATGARDPDARALFYAPDGEPLPVGTMLHNLALARTLEMLAKDGPEPFYRGELAQRIASVAAADTHRDGGMTAQDLADYKAIDGKALCGPYRGYTVCGMGPSSSGGILVLAMLGELEDFDLAKLGPGSVTAWHLFAEAQRLAYADRERYVADSAFVAVPVARLVDPAYLHARGRLISPDRTMASVSPGLGDMALADGDEPEEHGTSHFVAIDRAGEAVSWTSTVESSYGSGLMVGGFYLNNELTDFSFTATGKDGKPVVNRVEGGKRPRSSMAPTLVYGPDGRLVLAIGAGGGATIPAQVVRTIIGYIDWKLPILEASGLPVLFSPGDTLMAEQDTPLAAMLPKLVALGHKDPKTFDVSMTVKTNAIAIEKGRLVGASDPRGEGRAVAQ